MDSKSSDVGEPFDVTSTRPSGNIVKRMYTRVESASVDFAVVNVFVFGSNKSATARSPAARQPLPVVMLHAPTTSARPSSNVIAETVLRGSLIGPAAGDICFVAGS